MDLFEQFQETLTKNINKVVENSNKKRKNVDGRTFHWEGVFTLYPLFEEGLVIDIQLREETEEGYSSYYHYICLPVKTLLDDSLLETYMSKI